MLIQQSRMNHTRKKLINTTFNESIMNHNPQIQKLTDKLNHVTECIFGDTEFYNPLNLMKWSREKYHPNESQNRMRIENNVSLIRVCNQKIRSRIKPIKGALSVCFREGNDVAEIKNYKDHYGQIKQMFSFHKNKADSHESEEQPQASVRNVVQQASSTNDRSKIKYYQNLKKYSKVVQYVQGKMRQKSQIQTKTLSSFYCKTINIKEYMELGLNGSDMKKFSQSTQVHKEPSKRGVGGGKSFEQSEEMKTWMSKFYPSKRKQKRILSTSKTSKNMSVSRNPSKLYATIKSEIDLDKRRYRIEGQQQQANRFSSQSK